MAGSSVGQGVAHDGGKLGKEGSDLWVYRLEGGNEGGSTGNRTGGGQRNQGVGGDDEAGGGINQETVGGQKIQTEDGRVNGGQEELVGEPTTAELEGNVAGTPGADRTAISPNQPGTTRRGGGMAGENTTGGPRVHKEGGTAEAVVEVHQGGAGGEGV